MPSHKALVFTGPAEPFKLIERPTPKPGPGQVLVKNVAVALNPADYVIHNIGAWVDHYGYPALIGLDGAGEVAAIGEGVVSLNMGDRVLYQSLFHPDTLTAQEYTLADAVQVARVPPKLSFDEAATVPLGFSTAAVGLYQEVKRRGGLALTAPWEEGGLHKYVGKPVIVAGGASSVGQYALQLLKLSGFSPIIATASKHNEAYVKAAGATHVIDYHDVSYADLPAAVKMITAEPVSVIYDASGSPDAQKALWNILAPSGKIVTVGPLAVGKDGEVAEDGKSAAWVWGAANTPYNYEFGRKMYPALSKFLETGDIKPNNVEIIPNGLAGIPDALTRLALHKVSATKLVARVAETAGDVGGAGLKDAVGGFFTQNRSLIAEVGCLPDPF